MGCPKLSIPTKLEVLLSFDLYSMGQPFCFALIMASLKFDLDSASSDFAVFVNVIF
jgi:hypothetical protein